MIIDWIDPSITILIYTKIKLKNKYTINSNKLINNVSYIYKHIFSLFSFVIVIIL